MSETEIVAFTTQCSTGYCLWFKTLITVERCRQAQGRDWDGECNWRLNQCALVRKVKDSIVYLQCCSNGCAMDLKGFPQWSGECVAIKSTMPMRKVARSRCDPGLVVASTGINRGTLKRDR